MIKDKKIQVAIIGASGYVGEELLRLSIIHKHIELNYLVAGRYSGKKVGDVYQRFSKTKIADKVFDPFNIEEIKKISVDLIFLALPHLVSGKIVKDLYKLKSKIIDLSADFRLDSDKVFKKNYGEKHPFKKILKNTVYGLSEINKNKIKSSKLVANPGCYPTSILLPLLPLLKDKLISSKNICISSNSGVSGAGRNAKDDLLYCQCSQSARAYSPIGHRHICEIEQELSKVSEKKVLLNFVPHLIPIKRGMLSTIFTDFKGSDFDKVLDCYNKYYRDSYFVKLLGNKSIPDSKNVSMTNFIEISWQLDQRTKKLIILSSIDNIGKGASSQAIQNFNIMYGFDETEGLDKL